MIFRLPAHKPFSSWGWVDGWVHGWVGVWVGRRGEGDGWVGGGVNIRPRGGRGRGGRGGGGWVGVIRQTREEGPPGCEDFLEPVYFSSVCNEILLQPCFFVFSHFVSSKRLVFHFSCFMTHISKLMVNGSGPAKHSTYPQPRVAQDLRQPQNHPEKSLFF